ncbi:MAG: hypothetical protein CL608_02460 [Anaerolineaceae bacterium]|nr:hypothetical protein [Anaerolineaceae bacterium]
MKSLLGVLLAAIGGVGPLIIAFVPRLGIGFLAHLGKVNPLRRALGLLGWLLIWQEWRWAPSLPRRLALLPGTIFALQSQFLEPRRIFVDLVDPPHSPASRAQLPKTAVVLGATIKEQPHAWTYANLVPRHLINDVIGQTPVLAAY